MFSRALLSRALLLGISSNVLISRCNNFGFGWTTLNQKALYVFHSRQVSDYILVSLSFTRSLAVNKRKSTLSSFSFFSYRKVGARHTYQVRQSFETLSLVSMIHVTVMKGDNTWNTRYESESCQSHSITAAKTLQHL